MNLISSLVALAMLSGACSKPSESRLASESIDSPKIHSLEMNDISILMPFNVQPGLITALPRLSDVPNPERFAAGLPAAAKDAYGFVFPWTMEQRNTQLSIISSAITAIDDDMKDFVLASIRIDPCSNHLQVKDDDLSCTPEMRIVWQKVATTDDGSIDFKDSNVHTIYRLEAQELKDILSSIRELRKNASVDTSGMPLLPQPVIAKEGLDSPYLKGIVSIVHRYARASKLSEVANMAANTAVNWTLGHIGIDGDQAKHFPIPTLGEDDEIDTVNLGLLMTSEEGSFFAPHSISKVGSLVSSGLLASREPSAELKRELDFFPILKRTVEAFAVENPKLFNTKSINCSTCHVAQKQMAGFDFVHLQAGNKIWESRFARPSFDYPRSSKGTRERKPEEGNFLPIDSFGLYRYRSDTWNLDTPFDARTSTRLLMFSFVNASQPSIAARVVNDTAESLDYIEAKEL